MSFKRYPSMTESGVEWLGQVPSHWAVQPLKRQAILLTEKTDRREHPVALENIEGWTGRFIPTETEFEGEGVGFKAGDVLFGKLRPYLAKTLVAESQGEAVGDFLVMRPTPAMQPRFLGYQLRSTEVISIIDGSTFGSKMPRASWEFVGAMPFPLPPTKEQAAIAAFLDRETAKIDALVEEQKRLIALLKEKRQAVISQAVTKGLDPSVPMKDSGVEWLGEVPAHWEVRRVSSISTKITNGYVGPTRDILVDHGVRYLQSLHIKANRIKFDTPYFVTEDWSKEHRKSILQVGDLLIVQTGDIGQVAVVTDEFAGCNCHALIIVSPLRKVVAGEYLGWIFGSDYGKHSLLSIQTGALHPHLNCGNVKDLVVPLPPPIEQAEILKRCYEAASSFDALITEAQAAVELLSERRSALISAAVTGKIDVRGLVPQPEVTSA